ncbi:MAG: hypothetical protein HeimC3_11620 [Candidatus Heimdallarchaeota archaeon LC_3]|nr:MAG: hypothetical protein HeimC3_11620 [Candidatus Heimdallarchaeota archaeon LC_3]
MVKIEVLVKVNSKESKVLFDSDLRKYIVYLQSKPINNKANKELLKIVKKFFKAEKVDIVSGFQTNTKTMDIVNPRNKINT